MRTSLFDHVAKRTPANPSRIIKRHKSMPSRCSATPAISVISSHNLWDSKTCHLHAMDSDAVLGYIGLHLRRPLSPVDEFTESEEVNAMPVVVNESTETTRL